ncbi:hypothetical protein BC827DRAFT_905633 [Russula dissimulans]|nr:hypothetical protein BC827DRAFT_905633 [Russula dissimulans]
MTSGARALPLKPWLPPELIRPILQFTHPSDFDYRLCLVSRSFRIDVEAQFYKYVAVPEKRLLYFCRTMIARPDLARRVQRLAFTGAVHREPEVGDTEVVGRMMRLLVNLKDLSISASRFDPGPESDVGPGPGPGPGPGAGEGAGEGGGGGGPLAPAPAPASWPVHHDDVRILHGCTFKLERLACFFSWGAPLAQWLATQPQLKAFEHDGYPVAAPGAPGAEVGLLDDQRPALLECAYLRIAPYILACFDGREESRKPQPVVLRFDMRFNTVQEEFAAARSLGHICRNLKCLTLARQTASEEYLSTSRILRTFADRAPNLTCLAIYENIDYSAGENKRILRIIKEKFPKLQVFVWAPLNHPVTQNSDEDWFSSSSSGFSIDSCSEEDECSLDKMARYAGAMFDAVPTLRMFISYRKGPCTAWERASSSSSSFASATARDRDARPPPPQQAGESRPFKRAWLSIDLSEDTFRNVDPDHPTELFETSVPHGPPLAEPRPNKIYNVPIFPTS